LVGGRRDHHAIDFDQRFQTRLGRIDAQRVRDVRTAIQIVDVQRADFGDAALDELAHRRDGQDLVGLARISAVSVFNDVVRQNLALHVFGRDRQALDLRLFELAPR